MWEAVVFISMTGRETWNIGRLVAGAPNGPTATYGFQNLEMVASLRWRPTTPRIPIPITANIVGNNAFGVPQSNINERVSSWDSRQLASRRPIRLAITSTTVCRLKCAVGSPTAYY